MKKRKAAPRPVLLLPGAIQLNKDQGLFQYYKGDFFSLFASQPADIVWHGQSKQKYLDASQPVHLLFANSELLLEIHLHRKALDDYHDFAGVTNLATLVPFWSIGMEQAAKAFFNTTVRGILADRFLYARVIDLLVQLVHHIGQVHELKVDHVLIGHAEKAKQLIQDDLSAYDTVEQVARKVGISEADLQLAFKYRFGMTVGKFSKEERMKCAHTMLEQTDDILLSVALSVGYNDPGNFSVAFKNYFGYSPGYIQRKKKEFNSQQPQAASDQ